MRRALAPEDVWKFFPKRRHVERVVFHPPLRLDRSREHHDVRSAQLAQLVLVPPHRAVHVSRQQPQPRPIRALRSRIERLPQHVRRQYRVPARPARPDRAPQPRVHPRARRAQALLQRHLRQELPRAHVPRRRHASTRASRLRDDSNRFRHARGRRRVFLSRRRVPASRRRPRPALERERSSSRVGFRVARARAARRENDAREKERSYARARVARARHRAAPRRRRGPRSRARGVSIVVRLTHGHSAARVFESPVFERARRPSNANADHPSRRIARADWRAPRADARASSHARASHEPRAPVDDDGPVNA